MRRRSRLALALLPALAATAAAGVTAALRDDGQASAGAPIDRVESYDSLGVRAGTAPPVELPALIDGAPPVSLAALRGKPVVINFFSSTCVPCRKELPLLESASTRWGGQVHVVGVDHLDRAAAARRLVADTGVTFPVGYDPDGDTAVRYEVPALPATFFLTAEGTIAGRVLGALTATDLETRVAALAGGHPPST